MKRNYVLGDALTLIAFCMLVSALVVLPIGAILGMDIWTLMLFAWVILGIGLLLGAIGKKLKG